MTEKSTYTGLEHFDKVQELNEKVQDIHYSFTKKIADVVIEVQTRLVSCENAILKLEERLKKVEFEDEHEMKSIGGTTDD
jgi:hypothetical protein|tara:strand:+ start:868 stop:1107 length:240 start_codon:yes stop_codon:yes gene_type:complete